MATRNSLIALLAVVLLIALVVATVGRRTASEADGGPRTAPRAVGPAAVSIARPPEPSLDRGATTDASGMAPGGSPGPSGAADQELSPPGYGDAAGTDGHPTSMWPELADPGEAALATDPYPTSVSPEDTSPRDATPAADPFPTSLPDDERDGRDVATPPGGESASPTEDDSAAGSPDRGAPADPTQRPTDAHPTDDQGSPSG